MMICQAWGQSSKSAIAYSLVLSILLFSCPFTRSRSLSLASNGTSSDDLVFFLAPNHDPFEEGDIIESKRSGYFLEQLHGQLVLHQGDPLSSESTIVWKTRQAYVDDGSGISSVAIFQNDCHFVIYTETFLRQINRHGSDGFFWEIPIRHHMIDDLVDDSDCFLAWNISSESLVIHEGNIDSPGKEIGSRKNEIINNTSVDDIMFLIPGGTFLRQGFMVESKPPGLFLWHNKGEVYLYRGMPYNPNSDLLWKTDDAYIYNGDSIFTFTQLIGDGNFVIYGGGGVLWSSASSRSEGSYHYFLAWVMSEKKLAIFSSTEDYDPIEEIWSSHNFRWKPMSPGVKSWGQITVSVLTRFTSACSMMCSGLIIGIILSRWLKNRKVYSTRDRLLFGMSFLDFLASTANIFDVAAIPADTYGIMGAMGTQATCTAQGFFVQLGFGVPLYNCVLCLYTLCVVRFRWTDSFIATRIEPFMHITALGYSLVSATLGVVLDLYNSNGSFCWVAMYPHDCAFEGHVKCLRGVNAAFYQWIFAGLTIIFSFVVIIASMSIIYFHIQNNIKKMRQRYGESSVVNSRQLQEVGKQAFLYVTAFMITFIWPMSVTIERQIGITPPIWQNAMFSFFFTFQGFWNFLIFIRPMYRHLRRKNKAKSSFWVLRVAIRKEATMMSGRQNVQRVSRRNRERHTTSSQLKLTASSRMLFGGRKAIVEEPSLAMNNNKG